MTALILQGTNEVKGIVVNFHEDDDIPLNADSFSGMKNLEIFINKHGTLSGDTLNYLSNKLRVIEWNNCQLQYLPSYFHPKELVVFDMRWSRIRQLGKGFKNLAKLTSLNLRDSGFLEKIPDFSGMENLKYLKVTDCTSLIEVYPSVGFLDKLVTLDFSQ
ncbi:disease resistance protein RPS6-like [Prunus avium]|uniref:Disease resistance protein RPS6-like n=1 Tax=Prunus avium TaxID=42229 RepID=A0A6P5T0E3_PRUAV|nr:disease resistance protein RPS6-like [Prunus avium]